MYISDAILFIIIIILGIYMNNKTEKHKEEMRELKETLKKEHQLELSEQKERLENLHKNEIIKFNEELAKVKDGTIIPELESKIKNLEEELLNKKNQLKELEKRMPFRYMDEARRCYEEVYDDMLLIEKCFWTLGHASNIHQAIEIHRNIADEDLDKIDTPEWLRGTMKNYFNGIDERYELSQEENLKIQLNEKLDNKYNWFIAEMIMSLEEFTRNNDYHFSTPYHIFDFAIYLILITYLDMKKRVGFKQAVIFFNKLNENLKLVYEREISNDMIAQIFQHRYSIYNSFISHYKNKNIRKLKIQEALVLFLYFDDKLDYTIEYGEYTDEEEYDENILTDFFPELIPDISDEQKEEGLTYIDNITSFALDQEQLNEITELLQQL